MDCSAIRFTRHAVERMFERSIPPEAVVRIAREGEIIASYPEDRPLPSVLILGFERNEPLHLVTARDPTSGICFVITIYRPDPTLWSGDFKTRRP
jgi:hypothetical protein